MSEERAIRFGQLRKEYASTVVDLKSDVDEFCVKPWDLNLRRRIDERLAGLQSIASEAGRRVTEQPDEF